MRTTARALHPDSGPEALRETGKDEEASEEGDRKHPPSILKRSWLERRPHETEPLRTSRHVRFREPLEVAVHCKSTSPATSPRPQAGAGHSTQRPGDVPCSCSCLCVFCSEWRWACTAARPSPSPRP
ncbi:PREDICTED: nutritionally-regulated adipose and cardiac enriched protein homolog isoform X2 [Chinchilla lanigera]|uniref:nutritionally-regulated adipose and cardiac enriched protein homolog isoform X2 n=1 Tax=Chinchilla lanigera TaxID=34839 RepID=UPI00038EEFE7|nr:PREDICTED: nutritionally-regulated adipose and cardiac enriched protein homolog isoform X2 [Chinchilla lanigera]